MSARHRYGLRVGAMVMMAAVAASPAAAQGTRITTAVPATLGVVPDGAAILFAVTAPGVVRTVTLSVTMTAPNVGDYYLSLVSPDGTSHEVFSWAVNPGRPLAGTYTFADTASSTFFNAGYFGSGTVLPGTYKSNNGSGGVNSLDATFTGLGSLGTWRLQVRDFNGSNALGTVSAATLTLGLLGGTSAPATAASLGAIPDGGSSPYTPGPPRDVTFTVPPGGTVTHVRVSVNITHTYLGDLVATLISPSGRQHVLFGYTGATTVALGGSGNDLNGTYHFSDAASGMTWWGAATTAVLPSGHYLTTRIGPGAGGGQPTSLDTVFAGDDSAGVWTLRLIDGWSFGVGTVNGASLTLNTLPRPTSTPDTFTGAYATSLSVAAPGVLANDDDRVAGPMTAALAAPPANGTVSLAPTGAFTYTPRSGFTGSDTFTYRPANANGAGDLATVTIAVPTPTTVQAPTEFRASSVAGSVVTLRWTAPPGPVATNYVVEGGVAPGQVLAAVATGGPLPILTFQAPAGAYFLRVRAVAGGLQSAPSNEIPLVVATPAAPSAPVDLTGVVNGGTLGLSWRNTFAGGEPTATQLVVTGSAVGTTSLPLTETFAFAGVPAGSYTFRLRAVNGAGVSAESNPVTLTFPTGCGAAPAPPANFLAYAVGNVVHLVWDPPPAGAAATSYLITVGGSFSAAVPFAGRTLSTPAPPGAYSFTVASVNACGAGPATAAQTVFVP